MIRTTILISVMLSFLVPGTLVPKDTILVFYSGGKIFENTIRSIEFETDRDFSIRKVILDDDQVEKQIKNRLDRFSPKAVILIDNRSIEYFKLYQRTLAKDAKIIPSISIMAIHVEKALNQLKNAKGIAYEIPIVTSLVNLRYIIKKPIKRIGIIHRSFLKGFIDKNQSYCQNEGFEISTVELPNVMINPKKQIRKSLNFLIRKKGVEALWMPNDNVLITNKLLRTAWIPYLNKYNIPVLVGVEILANPLVNFGTLAVIPDHDSLGSQTAQILYDLKENDWVFKDISVDPPISVMKILNFNKAKRNFQIKEESLYKIDKVIK